MMRKCVSTFVLACFVCFSGIGQTKNTDLVSASFIDLPLENILDSLSIQTAFFFSYNAEILPQGSKFSITADNEPLDKFLSKLLTGTGLKFSIYKDQIILNYEPVPEPRKKKFFAISGVVTDERGNPMSNANVFLDGTTIGSSTDSNGVYHITGIPPGVYDLVISHVGYEQNSFRISEYEGSSRIINATMKSRPELLEEVEIVAKKIRRNNSQWLEYYELFKEELLGKTENSKRCVIENPEVLDFSYEDNTKTLRVFSKSPIIIRNDALGYRINYFLESFIKSPDNLKYRGKLRFRNIDASSKSQQRLWKKARRKSYLGSFNHFKNALLNQRLKKEGFRIFFTKKLDAFNKEKLETLNENDLLVYKGDHYDLSFKDYLLVEYRKEKESTEFLSQSSFARTFYPDKINEEGALIKSPGNQMSVIGLLKNKTRVDLEGQVMDKFALTSYGYWAWERMGESVPSNYDPKNKSINFLE